jgi:hypothetical protein
METYKVEYVTEEERKVLEENKKHAYSVSEEAIQEERSHKHNSPEQFTPKETIDLVQDLLVLVDTLPKFKTKVFASAISDLCVHLTNLKRIFLLKRKLATPSIEEFFALMSAGEEDCENCNDLECEEHPVHNQTIQ